MKRYYHEFKIIVGNNEYDTMIDLDLLSIESIEAMGKTTLIHTDSGMHIEVCKTKKEVIEIINSINE